MNSNNTLILSIKKIDQIVIPPSLKWLMYQEFHKKHSTYWSRKILYHLAKSKVYWPNMEKDIKFFIDNKCPCLASKKTTHCSACSIRDCNFNITNGHNSYRLPQSRQSSWWIWIYPRYNNQFTRYAEAYASTNKSAKTAAEKLFNDFVFKFGTSNRILHDQGKKFERKLFDELEKYFRIKRCRTAPYHPMCNDTVKRLNSTVIQMLCTLSEKLKYK